MPETIEVTNQTNTVEIVTGARGPTGNTGATGATGAAGPTGINWRGAWVTATAYAVNDAVESDESAYICTVAHTSGSTTQPETGASWDTNWDLLAKGGTPEAIAAATQAETAAGEAATDRDAVETIANTFEATKDWSSTGLQPADYNTPGTKQVRHIAYPTFVDTIMYHGSGWRGVRNNDVALYGHGSPADRLVADLPEVFVFDFTNSFVLRRSSADSSLNWSGSLTEALAHFTTIVSLTGTNRYNVPVALLPGYAAGGPYGFMASVGATGDSTSTQNIGGFSDGTTSERINLRHTPSNTNSNVFVTSTAGGGTQASMRSAANEHNSAAKVAVRIKTDDFHAAVNGTLFSTSAPDTSGDLPTGITVMCIGHQGNTTPSPTLPWTGTMNAFAWIGQDLTNAQLQTVST